MPGASDLERFLSIRDASGATFSPDGRFVAFLTAITGISQLWQVPVTGGWPTQLTFAQDTVSSASYSPFLHEIVYSMDKGGDERYQLYLLQGQGNAHGLGDGWDSRALTRCPEARHSAGIWSRSGERLAFAGNRDEKARDRSDVHVQDRTASEARRVMKGLGGYFSPTDWSRDGRYLLIAHEISSADQDIYLLDTQSGTSRRLTPHKGEARYESPLWAYDEESVWCRTTHGGRDMVAGARVNVKTAEVTFAVTPDHEVDELLPSPAGRWLAYTLNNGGRSELYLRDLHPRHRAGRDIPAPDLPLGVVSGLCFDPHEKALAFTFSGPQHNGDVWLWELPVGRKQGAGKLRQLTHSSRASLAFSEFIKPRLVSYPTWDKRMIPAWYFEPAGGAKGAPPPVIVYPHGGPEGQTRPDFDPILQYFCRHGYAVFAPNVRGSTGYGTAYMNLDNVEKRMGAVEDLKEGWKWLVEKKLGDPKRIAVYGWSYGGFMVLSALTTYPDLWAAGVDIVGICNFVTFLRGTSAYRRAHREAEYGSPERDGEFLKKISPIHHVDKIACPLLVIHGARDPRVPVGEARQVVGELRKRKHPVEYLEYADEGHGLDRLKNQLDAYPRIVAFLDRHVKGRRGS